MTDTITPEPDCPTCGSPPDDCATTCPRCGAEGCYSDDTPCECGEGEPWSA